MISFASLLYGNSVEELTFRGYSLETCHGHPFANVLHASLIMSGPDVPKVGSIGMVRMTQIAPTIAQWFGVSLAPNVDAPIPLDRPRS